MSLPGPTHLSLATLPVPTPSPTVPTLHSGSPHFPPHSNLTPPHPPSLPTPLPLHDPLRSEGPSPPYHGSLPSPTLPTRALYNPTRTVLTSIRLYPTAQRTRVDSFMDRGEGRWPLGVRKRLGMCVSMGLNKDTPVFTNPTYFRDASGTRTLPCKASVCTHEFTDTLVFVCAHISCVRRRCLYQGRCVHTHTHRRSCVYLHRCTDYLRVLYVQCISRWVQVGSRHRVRTLE